MPSATAFDLVVGVLLVLLILGAAWGMFLAYRVFQYLMKQNAELQLQVLSLSKNDNAMHYAGFKASTEANRQQTELVAAIRGVNPAGGDDNRMTS